MYIQEKRRKLTGLSNLDADGTPLECLSIACKGSLETLEVGILSIGKALGPLLLTVLNDAHVDDIAVFKKLGDSLDGRIVGQVAEMGGERRLVGQLLGQIIAQRVVTWDDRS